MTKREHQALEYATEVERPSCRTCDFFVQLADDEGECHRYPPSPAWMSGAVGEHAVTTVVNFCGEFKARSVACWGVPPHVENRSV